MYKRQAPAAIPVIATSVVGAVTVRVLLYEDDVVVGPAMRVAGAGWTATRSLPRSRNSRMINSSSMALITRGIVPPLKPAPIMK